MEELDGQDLIGLILNPVKRSVGLGWWQATALHLLYLIFLASTTTKIFQTVQAVNRDKVSEAWTAIIFSQFLYLQKESL